jgi:hypothetical protein
VANSPFISSQGPRSPRYALREPFTTDQRPSLKSDAQYFTRVPAQGPVSTVNASTLRLLSICLESSAQRPLPTLCAVPLKKHLRLLRPFMLAMILTGRSSGWTQWDPLQARDRLAGKSHRRQNRHNVLSSRLRDLLPLSKGVARGRSSTCVVFRNCSHGRIWGCGARFVVNRQGCQSTFRF